MSILGDTRDELADLLTGSEESPGVGFTFLPYVPARFSPPQGVIQPGSPYLEAGDTFGSFRIRLTVSLVVLATNNTTATADLDHAIAEAAVLLLNAKWGIGTASDPYPLAVNNATYLASDIAVSRIIRL